MTSDPERRAKLAAVYTQGLNSMAMQAGLLHHLTLMGAVQVGPDTYRVDLPQTDDVKIASIEFGTSDTPNYLGPAGYITNGRKIKGEPLEPRPKRKFRHNRRG